MEEGLVIKSKWMVVLCYWPGLATDESPSSTRLGFVQIGIEI